MFHHCVQTIGESRAAFGPEIARFGAFICSAIGTTEIPAEWPDWEQPVIVNGREVEIHDTVMTALLNSFSRCQALAVLSGFAPNGVLNGVQLLGNPYDGTTVFRVAAALENTLPLFGRAHLERNSDVQFADATSVSPKMPGMRQY